MKSNKTSALIAEIIAELDDLVPKQMEVHEDNAIAKGVVSVCIIDEHNHIYGKTWGTDKNRQRESFRIAWIKASQVWITGYKTNEFEKLVFADKLDFRQFGINMPDYIGWEGGQPIKLGNGETISVGFSGFRGTTDLAIVLAAVEKAGV